LFIAMFDWPAEYAGDVAAGERAAGVRCLVRKLEREAPAPPGYAVQTLLRVGCVECRGEVYVLETNQLVTSTDKSLTERFGEGARGLTVPTITLTRLLESERVDRIDFMSMDIELHEPKALAGFDIGRFRPSLVCIEAHPEVRQDIDYFTRHHYVVVGNYLRADEHNLYFAPLDAADR
jgi:Methyltransferase FkbM domain